MAKAIMGKEKVLYFRKKGSAEAGALVLQTEHSISASRESESTFTKFGNVPISSNLEEEISMSALQAQDDPMFTVLEDSVYDDYEMEVWEVDINKASTEGKYFAEYRQGKVTSWERAAGEEAATVEGTFVTNGKRVKGLVTLSPEQVEELQYVFHDMTPEDIADEGLSDLDSTPEPDAA